MSHYVAFRVPGHPDLHMTVCFIHALPVHEVTALELDVRTLSLYIPSMRVTVTRHAMFGEKNDVPVAVVDVEESVRPVLLAFYKKWYSVEPGTTVREVPTYHISLPRDGVPCPPELQPGSTLVLTELYMKGLKKK